MSTLHTNGIDIAFDSFGDRNNETILLIAGLGSQMVRWTIPFCESLAARGYQVIRFDNRDSGCSTHYTQSECPDPGALVAALTAGERPVVPYTLYDMAADTAGLIHALDLDRVHVVGRSMGGMIAQILASEYPNHVRSLTSIMSSSGNPTLPQAAPDIMALLMRPSPDPTVDPEAYLTRGVEFAQRMAGSGQPFNAEARRALLLEEVGRGYSPGGTRRQLAAVATAGDRRARLQTITVPTLVIHGSEDPLVPPACGADTAASIPNAKLLLIEGMGHELPSWSYSTVIRAIDQVARKQPDLN
jgi:pimeloyl-ACP methyl ester carboxylesterase